MGRKKMHETPTNPKKTLYHTICKSVSGMKYDFKSVLKTFFNEEWDSALKVNSTKKIPRSKGTTVKC